MQVATSGERLKMDKQRVADTHAQSTHTHKHTHTRAQAQTQINIHTHIRTQTHTHTHSHVGGNVGGTTGDGQATHRLETRSHSALSCSTDHKR